MNKMSMNGKIPFYSKLRDVISILVDIIAEGRFGDSRGNRTRAVEFSVLYTAKNNPELLKKALESRDVKKKQVLELMEELEQKTDE